MAILLLVALLCVVGFRLSVSPLRATLGVSGNDDVAPPLRSRENTLPLVVLAFLAGFTFLLAISFGLGDAYWNVRLSLVLTSITAAASTVGTLLGFLFGIPRFILANAQLEPRNSDTATDPIQQSGAPSEPASSRQRVLPFAAYRPSTNLDDIADWLTKIIVGVGLTQLNGIGLGLAQIGVAVRNGCGSACPTDATISSLVITSSIVCFLLAYLWTRLHYNKLAARSDRDTIQLLAVRQETASVAKFGIGGRTPEGGSRDATAAALEETDDPNKEQFGGTATANGRVLTAVVEPTASHQNLYRVTLTVSSTAPTHALTGAVEFYLHPTFRKRIVRQEVSNGVATLVLIAYGAFTVGAVADRGATKLELDLAELASAPAEFRAR